MATATQNAPVLIGGTWRPSRGQSTFHAINPQTLEPFPEPYPVSTWDDCEAALEAAVEAAEVLRGLPAERIAQFLEAYADAIDGNLEELAELAHRETALPVRPRLLEVEGPRTSNQLRQAAAAAREGSWAFPTIDTKRNIRSCYEPIGPVCVFGPNNFPLAFNSVSGGDFAAAIAAGNPVIGKANTSHPATTRRLAELALHAVEQTGLPPATVQLIYRTSHSDGERLVADRRVGAVGYTGSRRAGLVLKAAADAAGTPIYLELSSVNPVVVLPGALRERFQQVVDDFLTSVLMGTGQFCTNPGLLLLLRDTATEDFIQAVKERFAGTEPGVLLSPGVQQSLVAAIDALVRAGAEVVCGGHAVSGRCSVENTLLRTTAKAFLEDPEVFQTEAFGNASLAVVADSVDQLAQVIRQLEGNLTGCIYSATDGSDDAHYPLLASLLTQRVGRLLNDKMPTGVAVSPAMNHGGPFPATGHPGFTAVGIPASIHRFAKLTCYDAVRPERLPPLLRDANPTGSTWRYIDGKWTTADVPAA